MTWPDAIRDFRAYLALERSLSPNTLAAYDDDVQKFARYLDLQGLEISPLQVRREQLEAFVLWVNSLGLEASSQARLKIGRAHV